MAFQAKNRLSGASSLQNQYPGTAKLAEVANPHEVKLVDQPVALKPQNACMKAFHRLVGRQTGQSS